MSQLTYSTGIQFQWNFLFGKGGVTLHVLVFPIIFINSLRSMHKSFDCNKGHNVWKASLTNLSGASLWQPKLLQFFWSAAAVPWHHVNVVICTVCSEGWWCLTNWPPALLSKSQTIKDISWMSKICKNVKTSTGKTRGLHFLRAKAEVQAKGPQEYTRWWAVPFYQPQGKMNRRDPTNPDRMLGFSCHCVFHFNNPPHLRWSSL